MRISTKRPGRPKTTPPALTAQQQQMVTAYKAQAEDARLATKLAQSLRSRLVKALSKAGWTPTYIGKTLGISIASVKLELTANN